MIEVRNLTRLFGTRTAVEDVSFSLGSGQICALLGPNGAGKTTTVRLLMGLIGPTAGDAIVAGTRVPGSPTELADLRGRVGLLTETPGFYDRLSALENLTLFGRLYRLEPKRLAAAIEGYLRRLDLWDRRHDAVATFSKGMKQRLAIIRAVFHEPDVIFFDEPTAGLDPESARDVRRLIGSLKQAGRTIVVCTHNLTEAGELADLIGVLKGRLVAFGTPATLGRSSGVPRVRIVVVGEPERARAVLAPRVVAVDGHGLDIEVGDPAREVPEAVASLVRAGIGIREVRPIELSLEARYLAAIGSN